MTRSCFWGAFPYWYGIGWGYRLGFLPFYRPSFPYITFPLCGSWRRGRGKGRGRGRWFWGPWWF